MMKKEQRKMKRIPKYNSETNLQIQIADYLRLQYPNVIFHSDYGSGANLNAVQAIIQKRQNGGRRAWPDMFVAEPKMIYTSNKNATAVADAVTMINNQLHALIGYAGLMIEVKKDGTKLKREKDCKKILKGETKLRKAGDWWDKHIEEQAEMLEKLRNRGYKAEFAVGFEQAKNILDKYLG